MGLRGPPPKPDDRRQRRNKRPALTVVHGIKPRRVPAPPVPDGLLVATRKLWTRYWAAPISRIVEASDEPAIVRLFRLYDERDRAYRGIRKRGRLVVGSQGQEVLNPLAKYIAQCDAEIRSLEDRFGLSAKARLQLGITFGEAQKTLEDLNRDLDVDDDDRDPRLEADEA